MNAITIAIPAILLGSFVFELIVELLNLRNIKPTVPQEMQEFYDEKEYKKSQAYLKENTHFGLFESAVSLLVIIFAIYSGFLNQIDLFSRTYTNSELLSGLLFITILLILNRLLSLPFSYYQTFKIEDKYGFNRQTKQVFIIDQLKYLVVTLLLGLPLAAILIYLFQQFGRDIWLIALGLISIIQLVLYFFAPVVFLPLFNKFTPLEEGRLRTEIERFAKKQNFKLEGIYKMDGSKRSTKSNAFFTGFGKYKRIALFDTLIEKHTVPELVSVLAHEIGHYKKRHIWKLMLLSIVSMGIMLYLLSRLIGEPSLPIALNFDNNSVYLSLVAASLLFSPLGTILGIVANYFSRKYEYEADEYAVKKYKHKQAFITALKKLSVSNLSNLYPHPLKVIVDYSHPPILERIKSIINL